MFMPIVYNIFPRLKRGARLKLDEKKAFSLSLKIKKAHSRHKTAPL